MSLQGKFRTMVVARDALTVDPDKGRKKLSQIAKNMVAGNDSNSTDSTAMSLERQTRALQEEAAAEHQA